MSISRRAILAGIGATAIAPVLPSIAVELSAYNVSPAIVHYLPIMRSYNELVRQRIIAKAKLLRKHAEIEPYIRGMRA